MRVLLFSVIFFLMACSDKEQLHLIDKFSSYQSQADVKQIVGNIEFNGKKEGLSTGRVDYEHLSEKGKLGLLFYEDQLISVGFYPIDTISYLDKLEEVFGRVIEEKLISYKGVMIQKGFDYEMGSIGGMFVSWTDPNLQKDYEGRIWQ